jgi:hypothetical protein
MMFKGFKFGSRDSNLDCWLAVKSDVGRLRHSLILAVAVRCIAQDAATLNCVTAFLLKTMFSNTYHKSQDVDKICALTPHGQGRIAD